MTLASTFPGRLSFRACVAAICALVATVVICAIVVAFMIITRANSEAQFDRTLDAVSVQAGLVDQNGTGSGPVVARTIAPDTGGASPDANEEDRTSSAADETRQRTISVQGAPSIPVVLTVPEDALTSAIEGEQIKLWIAAIVAILFATTMGWVLAGRVTAPLRALAAAARRTDDSLDPELPLPRGPRETAELTSSIEQMLERIRLSQKQTSDALETARDFASVCAHELRTPLTSMRTDLEVLSELAPTATQRAEIVGDLLSTQRGVETTLDDLERLSLGELSDSSDYVTLDLVELVDRVVDDAERRFPVLDFDLTAPEKLVIRGLPTGLRIAAENAITNAVRHGRATRVEIAVRESSGDRVEIRIADNGVGIPADERPGLFEKFARGSTARAGGSGLGLALIAQQATLHSGTAELRTSDLGGTEVCLEIRTDSGR